ncbi:MAG: DNA polymerase III subunit gamma/tau [Bacteroidales bacterium]|nr:DNA polymerase III subunit gamma/tau [Bacteroidales bacterium]
MENFIVSARKYRPNLFKTVVGQESITKTLQNAIVTNQVAQAFLFCGPRGVGKTTCARILAKALNCKQLTPEGEPCNECESCISFDNNASMNIYELDAASNNSVDKMRELVDQVRIPPQGGKYKVYIIDEVHMLTSQAFNAFLKTLEEPPLYAKFILATTEKHKIIPTILSRCQIFDFRRITVDDIAGHLRYVAESEGVTAEEDALHMIAQKADGGLRDALSIFDQMVSFSGKNLSYADVISNLNILDYDSYFRIVDYIAGSNIKDSLILLNEIVERGFDPQYFITGLGSHIRNLIMAKYPTTVSLMEVSENVKAKFVSQAKFINSSTMIKMLDITNKTDLQYRESNNKRLSVELAIMKMCQFFDADESQEVQRAVAQTNIKKQEQNEAKPEIANVKEVKDIAENRVEEASSPKLETKQESEREVVEYKTEEAIEEEQKKAELAQKPESSTAEPVSIPKSKSMAMPSFKQALNVVNDDAPIEYSQNKVEDLNLELIEKSWLKVVDSFGESSSFSKSGLSRASLDYDKDSNLLNIRFETPFFHEEFKTCQQRLIQALRQDLGVTDLSVISDFTPVEKNEEHDPYTSEEKFRYLATENPELIKFKQELGLDILK